MPYLGEIRMFAGNFAPSGWLFCNGQTLPIAEYDVLFNLIGTTYGGDGEETFNLPDLRGRLPVHQGAGPGLSTYQIGEMAGVETVTVSVNQLPQHNHAFLASTASGATSNPENKVLAVPTDSRMYLRDTPALAFPANTLAPVGGSQPHDNLAPVLVINFIINLFGVFPHQ